MLEISALSLAYRHCKQSRLSQADCWIFVTASLGFWVTSPTILPTLRRSANFCEVGYNCARRGRSGRVAKQTKEENGRHVSVYRLYGHNKRPRFFSGPLQPRVGQRRRLIASSETYVASSGNNSLYVGSACSN